MNNLCERLNLLDFNKWNCPMLLCGAIKLILLLLLLLLVVVVVVVVVCISRDRFESALI